jgi:hypothetical protein
MVTSVPYQLRSSGHTLEVVEAAEVAEEAHPSPR